MGNYDPALALNQLEEYMANRTIPPSDVTGRRKQELEKRHAEELARKAKEMALTVELEQEEKTEVVDYTDPDAPVLGTAADDAEEADELDPTIEAIVAAAETQPEDYQTRAPGAVEDRVTYADRGDSVLVRANADLEQVTLGVGKHYDFEAGRKYRLSFNDARHLAENGYVDILR